MEFNKKKEKKINSPQNQESFTRDLWKIYRIYTKNIPGEKSYTICLLISYRAAANGSFKGKEQYHSWYWWYDIEWYRMKGYHYMVPKDQEGKGKKRESNINQIVGSHCIEHI